METKETKNKGGERASRKVPLAPSRVRSDAKREAKPDTAVSGRVFSANPEKQIRKTRQSSSAERTERAKPVASQPVRRTRAVSEVRSKTEETRDIKSRQERESEARARKKTQAPVRRRTLRVPIAEPEKNTVRGGVDPIKLASSSRGLSVSGGMGVVPKTRYVEGIVVRSDRAISQYGRRTERDLRAKYISSMLNAIGKFELFYYPFYFIGGLLCLLFLPLTFTLVCSILSMWFALLANNLVARGYRFGLLLSTAFMLLYTIVSGMTAVWGEVIMNVLFYIPLEIQGFVKWKDQTEDSGKIQELHKLSAKGWGVTFLVFVGIFLGFWLVLDLILKQAFAWINCLSIAGFMIGNMLRNKQYIEVWYFFMIGNISGIAMWAVVAFSTGTAIDLSVLPLMLSFSSSLLNNFNGLAIWKMLFKTTQKSSGVVLTRRVSVKQISKLRKKFHNMRCTETSKIVK